VAKYHNQEDGNGIDYVEIFAYVTTLEATRMLFAFASFIGIKSYQMDGKCAFLNGYLQEKVYVEQALYFENLDYPYHVLKLYNAFYISKQALKSCYKRLSMFLIENDLKRIQIDKTLFVRSKGKDFLPMQIYVVDKLFHATNESLCKEFFKLMSKEFKMSMRGELNFLLGPQIKQC